MKYLFFDIECANCFDSKGKICEFGYTLVDENFSVIESNNLLVNPNDKFDWYVQKNLLEFKPEVYRKYPDYNYYYNKIASLFTNDTIIFGHTIDADSKYLNDESTRYNLPFFSYSFYDVKVIYKNYSKEENYLSVQKICEELDIPMLKQAHNAYNDAEATMLIVKKLCEKEKITIDNLIKNNPDSKGTNSNGKVVTLDIINSEKKRKEDIISPKNKFAEHEMISRFIYNYKVKNATTSELNGKRLSVSQSYEEGNYSEIIALIQVLASYGCKYTFTASDCDYFVNIDVINDKGKKVYCPRKKYVSESIKNGKNIKIITYDELLSTINVTRQQLLNMKFPDEKYFAKKPKVNKTKKVKNK